MKVFVWSEHYPDYDERMEVMADSVRSLLQLWDALPIRLSLVPKV